MRVFLSMGMGMGGFNLSPWLLLLAEATPTLPVVDRPSLKLWLSPWLRLPRWRELGALRPRSSLSSSLPDRLAVSRNVWLVRTLGAGRVLLSVLTIAW